MQPLIYIHVDFSLASSHNFLGKTQRFVCRLVLSILLASVIVSAKQSGHRVRLFKLKLFTKQLVVAPGPRVVYDWRRKSWCSPPLSVILTTFNRWDSVATTHRSTYMTAKHCLIYALWSCQWEKLHRCFNGKGIINAWIRLTNCTADNLLKEIFKVVSQAVSVGTSRAECGIYEMSHNCAHSQWLSLSASQLGWEHMV